MAAPLPPEPAPQAAAPRCKPAVEAAPSTFPRPPEWAAERVTAWLALPIVILLFAQWPLREWLQRGSREANDLGQILFALYMAVAVGAASRQGLHLSGAGHALAPNAVDARRRARWILVLTGPWAAFLLWTSAAATLQSLMGLERFPETFNPGYFLIKAAAWLLAARVLLDAVMEAVRAPPGSAPHG